MAHDVFVSYSSKDKVIADAVVSSLENKHIRCWYAPRDVKPSDNWGKAISDAIEKSKVFLVIFSGHANKSQRVLDELNLAISNEEVVLPFRIENLEPDGAMKLNLTSRHWLDAYEPSWDKYLSKLTKTVASILENPGSAEIKGIPKTKDDKDRKKQKQNNLPKIVTGVVAGALLLVAGWVGFSSLNRGNGLPATSEVGTAIPLATTIANKGLQDPESGHWYRVVTANYPNMVWEDIKNMCVSLGGYLAIIDSPLEDNFVYKNIFLPKGGRLGATNDNKEGRWLWVTGESMGYTNWGDGEPDGCGGTDANNCIPAHFLIYDRTVFPGQWRDASGPTSEYICEFDS